MSSEHIMKTTCWCYGLRAPISALHVACAAPFDVVDLHISLVCHHPYVSAPSEELYQSGYISYPRTETDSFSARTDLHMADFCNTCIYLMTMKAIVQEQQAHPVWGPYAQRLLDPEAALWRNPASGGHDDKAHPPIHPTKFSAMEPGPPCIYSKHNLFYF
ncbi:DNA topoisomerase 3-alpha [Bienertia sinuspersici]